jgi:hypothetical protein
VSPHVAARLAWSISAVTGCLLAAALILWILNLSADSRVEDDSASVVVVIVGVIALSMVGAVVASRHSGNAIGWLFCLSGLAWAVSGLANEWGVYGLFTDPGALPAAEVAAWLSTWLFAVPLFAITPLTLLLFPDGRPPTPRWRPVSWLVWFGLAAVVVGSSLAPGKLGEEGFRGIDNPVGVDGARGVTDAIAFVGFSALLLAILLGMAALVVRFRRARGDERLQLKWFVAAGALFVLACLSAFSTSYSGVDELLVLTAFSIIPLAAGLAILKYRLYEFDAVINRALVYSALTASLGAAYLGSVLLLQLVLSPGSDLAVAGSTLAVAALFRPARGRIQELVDRRFYRRRYDAAQTLERFGGRLRDEVDLDTLGADLRAVVSATVQPAHVSLWLRSS